MRGFKPSLKAAERTQATSTAFPGDGAPNADDAGRTRLHLIIFMRCLAGIWAIQGLVQWSAILLPPEPLFEKVTVLYGTAVVLFALLDLIAAVGLWLLTPWGSVIWLFSAIAQIVASFALPGLFSLLWAGADILLIAAYFTLTWRASGMGPRWLFARQR